MRDNLLVLTSPGRWMDVFKSRRKKCLKKLKLGLFHVQNLLLLLWERDNGRKRHKSCNCARKEISCHVRPSSSQSPPGTDWATCGYAAAYFIHFCHPTPFIWSLPAPGLGFSSCNLNLKVRNKTYILRETHGLLANITVVCGCAAAGVNKNVWLWKVTFHWVFCPSALSPSSGHRHTMVTKK